MKAEAVIEIGERTIGLWSVALPGGDFLGHMGYNAEGKIEIVCRLRWYKDDRLGAESRDDKKWWRIVTKETEAEGLRRMRLVFEDMLERSLTHKGWELLRGARSVEDFAAALTKMPGMHITEDTTKKT